MLRFIHFFNGLADEPSILGGKKSLIIVDNVTYIEDKPVANETKHYPISYKY